MGRKQPAPHAAPVSIDAVIEECLVSRGNFYLGLWAGRQIGIADALLHDYARSVAAAEYEEPGSEDVFRKLLRDFAANGVAVSRDEIEHQLYRSRAVAARQFAASD
jgi:hypothetical protein